MSMIPQEAFDAAMAKLEGNPEPEPVEEPEPVAEPEPEPEPVVEGGDPPLEEPEPAVVVEPEPEPVTPTPPSPEARVFTLEEVQALLTAKAAGAPLVPESEPEKPVARAVPAHIAALIESGDDGAKKYGEAALVEYNRQEDRIEALERRAQQEEVGAVIEKIEAEQKAVRETYALPVEVKVQVLDASGKPVVGEDGKPQVKVEVQQQDLTAAQEDAVADWLLAHPREAQVLTIEEATKRVYPNLVPRTKKSQEAAPKPGQDVSGRRVVKMGGPARPVSGATVQGGGAAVGRVARSPEKPPANETIEQAIHRGAKALGL